MTEKHELMGGKLHVYRRENSDYWQCSTYLAGKNWRVSTKEESLAHAKDFAQDWYLELMGKSRAGVLKVGKTFKQAADLFLHGVRDNHRRRTQSAIHGNHRVNTPGSFASVLRQQSGIRNHAGVGAGIPHPSHDLARGQKDGRTQATGTGVTVRMEIVVLRQVLKAAYRHGWLPYLPDLSAPYKASGKISHRAWFSPEEYKMLYEATRERMRRARKVPTESIFESNSTTTFFSWPTPA